MPKAPPQRTYPACDKLGREHDKVLMIQDFLEWVQSEKRAEFAAYHKHTASCYNKDEIVCGCSEERLVSLNIKNQALIYEFLELDAKAIDKERQRMLDDLGGAEEDE